MKIIIARLALLFSLLLSACAGPPPLSPARGQALLNDALFSAPSDTINAAEVFALSAEMRQFIAVDIADQLRIKGMQQGLFDALYSEGKLKIDYDAGHTKNAAQAFSERAGNCMSLVLMTAAFAKEIGLEVQFQNVTISPSWSRNGKLLLSAGHVNIVLLEKHTPKTFFSGVRRQFTVDFLPPEEMRHLATEIISEKTAIAMFMNNRAAESLAQGQLDNAYGWVRAAITQDPSFINAYNTLGAIYRAHGNLQQAQTAFIFALEQNPKDTSAMLNLSYSYRAQGRIEEADLLVHKIEKIRPHQAYYFFNLGQQAMKDGDFNLAKDLFNKEVHTAPDNPEFNFWLASALYKLGDFTAAQRVMTQAIKNSTNPRDHDIYVTKLDRIKAAEKIEKERKTTHETSR
jgi:tetratricopeptide (TPR) repeat protein